MAPACVLISGAMEGAWCWTDRLCQKITDAGFRVLRYDHRDIGRSTQNSGPGYRLQDLTEDVIAILDALGIQNAHFVGHSMGGYICQMLAIDFQERVLSICPLGSGPLGDLEDADNRLSPDEQKRMDQTWGVYLARQDSDNTEEHIRGFLEVYRYLHGTLSMDERIARRYVTEMLSHSPKETLQAGNCHEMVMRELMQTSSERKGILKRIQVPTLVMHGDHDYAALPRFAIAMSNEIPGAHLCLLAGMGHMFFSEGLEDTLASHLIAHMRGLPHV